MCIAQVGSHRVTSPEDVLGASFFLTATDETIIRVAREGSEMDLSVMPIDPRTPAISSPETAAIPTKADR